MIKVLLKKKRKISSSKNRYFNDKNMLVVGFAVFFIV